MQLYETMLNILELAESSNLNKKFFYELTSLVSCRYDNAESSIFTLNDCPKLLATTIEDADEITFLIHSMNNTYKEKGDAFNTLVMNRQNVKSSTAIPLKYFSKTNGFWIIEDYLASQVLLPQEDKNVLRLVAYFIGAYVMERESKTNYYIDPMLDIPGRVYFTSVVTALVKSQADVFICIIKLCNMTVSNNMNGFEYSDKNLRKLSDSLKRRGIINVFRLDGSSLAYISNADRIQTFDILSELFHQHNDEMDIKAFMRKVNTYSDNLYAEIEENASETENDTVKIIEEKMFMQQPTISLNLNNKQKTKQEEEVDFDIFDFF